MSETALTNAQAEALWDQDDATSDFEYGNPYEDFTHKGIRKEQRIVRMAWLAERGRVFKDGTVTFGVRAIDWANNGTRVTKAAAATQALTDEQTNYIYYTPSGTLTVNITGFPTTRHIPLAQIAVTGATFAYTDVVDKRVCGLWVGNDQKVTFSGMIPGEWKLDGDAKNGGLAGLDQALDLTATEAAAAYCKVHDDSDDYYNLAVSGTGAGYTANYQLYPDTELENDAAYFGASVAFCQIWIDMATNAVYGADSITWEYWDGDSWEALTILYDHTDADDQDGDRPFQQDGAITFIPPSDWAAVAVDSQTAYWIRARCNATVNITTIPKTNSVEHYTCAPTDGIYCPADCTITDIRLCDQADTVHTTADVKFILFNFTAGTYTGELTFAQDKRVDAWSAQTMTCSAGDKLGVLVTQEDTAAEVDDGLLEFIATLA